MPTRNFKGKAANRAPIVQPVLRSSAEVIDFMLSHGGRTQESPPRERRKSARTRPGRTPVPSKFRFIDLFCGIGGFRLDLQTKASRGA